jgi:hypothetical protein
VVVHSALPPSLAAEVADVLGSAGVGHEAHGADEPVNAGVAAAEDSAAIALIGPIRSRAVAETLEATAPAGLPLIAPMATWAGVTRDDEPGCDDDPADHRGTVFRLLARDTEVAARIAADVRSTGTHAFVVAGRHEYGDQLDGQLRLGGLPRTLDADSADLVVLCGFAGEPEIEEARSLAPLPVVAFDGVQGADLGDEREVFVALPFAPSRHTSPAALFSGVEQARRAAKLVVEVVAAGASDRLSVLTGLRSLGAFDEHGDPIDPDVWLWRRHAHWRLEPARPLPSR